MILHYLKIAVRSILKYKGYHLISALCLAVGIVCFSYVWLFISAVNAQKRLPDYDRRLSLYAFSDGQRQSRYTGQEVVRLEEELKRMGVDGLAVASRPGRGEIMLTDGDGREMPYIVQLSYANPYYFDYWGMSVLQGSLKSWKPLDVALSASFARRVFGGDNPIGQTLRFVDDASSSNVFRVAAVVDSDRTGVQSADCYFSSSLEPDVPKYPLASCFLPQGMVWRDFEDGLRRIVWQRGNESLSVSSYVLSSQDGQERIAQTLLLCVGALILVSALINYLKFVIQMFYSRQRELVLRKCMGSGLGGLYGLLASEMCLMLTVALLLSLVLTECVFPVLGGLLSGNFPAVPVGDVYLIQCGVYAGTLLAGLAVACSPVLRLRRCSLQASLLSARRRHTFRNLMMGVQLAISMFFVGGVLLISDVWNGTLFNVYMPLSAAEQGRTAVLPVNSRYLGRNMPPLLSKIRQMAGVEDLTRLASYSTSDFSFMDYECKDGSRRLLFGQSGAPDYFRFFRIPMQGEEVPADAEGQVYVSRSFREWLDKEGNAGYVRLNGRNYQIAGVYEALYAEPQGEEMYIGSVYFPSSKASSYYIRISESVSVRTFMDGLAGLCRTFVPETLPLDLHLLPADDSNRSLMGKVRWGLVGLSGVSLLLVILSVYSSVSLDALSRRKEVALRKINGAARSQVFRLFARAYVCMFLVAYAIVCPLLYLLFGAIFGGAYRPHWLWAVWLFLAMLALLTAVTARKIVQVMRINPADAIRKE